MSTKHLIKATVGLVVHALPTTIIGPNDSRTVRWDYSVTFQGARIDSTCNGTYATEKAATIKGKKEARDWAAYVLGAAVKQVAA